MVLNKFITFLKFIKYVISEILYHHFTLKMT